VDALTRLALDARDGDEVALAGFVRASQADVHRLAAHLVDPQSADDVTQEVYVRAIPALARYRADAPARLWLLSIARRTCADVIRRRGRQRRLWQRLVAQPDPARVEVAAPPQGAVDLAALLDDLDPDRRQAFVLTQVLGLGYAEAAEVAGVPVGTIRSRVSRARGDLTAALAADLDDGATGADEA
jgi:RNA polymerase sigma-70 factor, ECF subfamily